MSFAGKALPSERQHLAHWRPVAKGDVIYIPAGTIHAIVLAEIQQRSDATFRLLDCGRQRELHEDNGVAVGRSGSW